MNQPITPPPFGTGRSNAQMTLRDLWRGLVYRRWLVLGTAGVVVAITAVVTAFLSPIYESEAVLRITSDRPQNGMLDQLAPLAGLGLPGLAEDDLDTEIGIIRSRKIADAVVTEHALQVELLAPGRPRSKVLDVRRAGPDAVEGTYVLRRKGDDTYVLSWTGAERGRARKPESVRIGEPFEYGNMSLAVAPSLGADPPKEIRFRVHPFREVVEEMRERLEVGRQEGRSRLVEISYRHTDPQLAAGVVNSIVQDYLTYKLNTSKTEARSTVGILGEQVATYQQQLRDAENRLQEFQQTQQVVAPQEQAEQQIRRMAEIQAQRDALVVERQALAQILSEIDRAGAGSESPYRRLATFPSFISNRAVQDLLLTLTELENKRAELLTLRTEASVDVRAYSERIAELERQLYRLGTNYLRGLNTQIASTNTVLAGFGRELSEVPAREIEFARLVREQKLLSELYLMLRTRLKEAEVQEAIDNGNVRILDPGLVPEEPVSPRPLINLLLASVLGLMLGLMVAVGRDAMDSTVRSRFDAEEAAGGLAVLGTIPRLSAGSGAGNGNGRARLLRFRRVASGNGKHVDSHALLGAADPWGPAAEAYRALLTSITLGENQMPGVLVVTSALPRDGKSTVASNLASTLARQGIRTLLVDADVQRGRLDRAFGVERAPGLSEVLLRTCTLSEAIRTLALEGPARSFLHLLPAGGDPAHPVQLLGPDRLKQLVHELRAQYEVVIFDAPPLHLTSDAALLGTLADSTLLVVRNGATDKEAVESAASELRRVRAPVGGVVLNDFDPPGKQYSYGFAEDGYPGRRPA